MSFAALLLAASAPTATVADAPRMPVVETSGRASVRILKGERVDASRENAEPQPHTQVYRDAAGTLWVEFS